MKKTLVAIAALAAVSSFAQSSVTLYGVGDIWLGSLKSGVPGVAQNQLRLNSGGLSGSRFGLRGTEDLGGGLSANFTFENGFNLDDAATSTTNVAAPGGGTPLITANTVLTTAPAIFGRQAFIGLNGGFGGIRLGRQYSAYDDLRGATDTMGHSSFSSTVAFGAWERNGLHYTFRVNNQLRYNTPNLGGFTGVLAYGLGENKTATASADNILSAHLLYANGPITAGLAIQNEKSGAANLTLKHTLIAGAYDFGVAKVNLGFNNSKLATVKDNEFQIGATVPFGAFSLAAAYATSKTKVAGTAFTKANSVSLQGIYALSKRTNVYAGLVNASTKASIGGATQSKTNLVATGIRHTF